MAQVARANPWELHLVAEGGELAGLGEHQVGVDPAGPWVMPSALLPLAVRGQESDGAGVKGDHAIIGVGFGWSLASPTAELNALPARSRVANVDGRWAW